MLDKIISKKKTLPFAVLLLAIFSCAQEKAKNPKAIAQIAFDKILNAQEKDFEFYDKNFAQYNDLVYLVKHNKVNDTIKSFILDSLNVQKVKLEKEKNYNQLKEGILNQNIIGNKTVFVDFTYKYDKESFFDLCKGVLYFSFEKKIYMVNFVAFKIDDYYKLAELSDVRLKTNDE